MFFERLEDRSLLATVSTDSDDYLPGDTALISASGFQVGETVEFQVVHTDGTPNTGGGHEPWTVQDGSPADLDGLRDGNVQTSWYVDPDDSAFSSFSLTAYGFLSGLSASTTFTDAPAADLDHFGNVTGEWLDGNLGSNKANYLEGQSVPERIVFTDLTPGESYSITIAYDTTKSGKHAFDYLTTYNRTVNPDPLDGTSGVNATTSTFPIPVDANVTNGQNGIDDGPVGPTGGDDITQIAGNFTYFGGTITAVSGYTRSPDSYTGDSTTTITVTFTPLSATSVLAFGAHIATRQDWGQSNSAVFIDGSPYHVSLAGASANLGTVGSQDHQLQSTAIIFPAQITVIKDVTGGQDPQDFSFAISASAGTQPSPANFILDDDSNSATPDTQVFSVTNFANYTVSETLLAGWTTSITVTDPNGVVNPVNSNQTTIAVTEGQNWTLVFNNLQQPPVLTITKDFTNPPNDAAPTNDTPEEMVTAGGAAGTFYIIVANTGASAADNVHITDTVDSRLIVDSVTASPNLGSDQDPDAQDIDWLISSLAAGQSVTLTVTYSVASNVDTQLVNNTATVDSDEITPVGDSDEITPVGDSDDVQIVENAPLTIAKDFSNPGNDAAGDTPEELATAGSSGNTFFIIVTNTGTSTADNVVISDLVPAALTVTNVSGTLGSEVAPTGDNNIQWSIPSLAAGQSATLTVTYSVASNVDTQLVNNTATVDSDEITPVGDSDDVQIRGGNIIIIGPDKTNSSLPFVHVFDTNTSTLLARFKAYDQGKSNAKSYRGGVRVATGDVNGDGVDEIITAPGRNYKPLIRIFSQDGTLLDEFLAYKSSFVGGVDLAVADMNGDGLDDIVTGMSYNGNEVRVFRSQGGFEFGGSATAEAPRLTAFNPLGVFKGGVVVRLADMGNVVSASPPVLDNTVFDNRPEIIIGNGPGLRSTVSVFGFFPDLEPATITAAPPVKLRTFTPFAATFKGGISIEVARVNSDQVPDIIASTGSGGGSKVQILDGLNGVGGVNGALITPEFSAFPKASFPSSFNTPLRITVLDTDGDGDADRLMAYQGTDGKAGRIRRLNLDGTAVDQILESQFDSIINGSSINDFLNAYFVATIKKPAAPPRIP